MRRARLAHRSGLAPSLAQLALLVHLRVARDLPRHLHTRKSAQPLRLAHSDVQESHLLRLADELVRHGRMALR